jgi:Leucine-rich repeat (LRR) protein
VLLEELNLEGNKLTALPEKLYKLKKLRILKLGGNSIDYREKERIQKELPRTEIYF